MRLTNREWPVLSVQADHPAKKSHATSSHIRQDDNKHVDAGAEPPMGLAYAVLAGTVVSILLVAYALWRFARKMFAPDAAPARKDANGFIQADYRIPHCQFVETADGFKVSFRRQLGMTASLDPANIGLAGLVVLPFWILTWIIALPIILFRPTTIEVNASSVIVNGKKMRRQDVGDFFIAHTTARRHRDNLRNFHDRYQHAFIGYTFGNKTIDLPMIWRDDQAEEFVAFLNQRIRQTAAI